MAIRFDPTLTAGLARELTARLGGARVKAVFLDRRSNALHLYLREHTLLVRLSSVAMDVALHAAAEPPPEHHPLPCTFRGAEAVADERIILCHLQPIRGRRKQPKIVLEFIPNRANALVVEGAERTIRHLLVPRPEAARRMVVGHAYPGPLRSERLGVHGSLTPAQWEAFLADLPGENLRGELLRRLAYVSAVNVDAILECLDDGRVEAGHALWLALAGEAPNEPVALETPKGLQPYPMRLPNMPGTPTSTLLEAFELVHERVDEAGPSAGLVPGEMVGRVEAQVKRARKRVGKLERELREADDPETLRAVGGLLLARLAQVPKGAGEVELEDFDGMKRAVRLDPRLSPQDNATRYFDEAARATRARERVPGLLAEAQSEHARWTEILAGIRTGEIGRSDVEDALPDGGPPSQAGATTARPLPYRRYKSTGGIEIRVGRGSKHNDDLTFHHSHPDDVWLHARHAAGAHVVLRWTRPEPPPARDLEEAAVLAALHSKARTSGSVPVDWTRRKYVRKPRKAAKGSVLVDRAQTLFVAPDPDLLGRLSVPD